MQRGGGARPGSGRGRRRRGPRGRAPPVPGQDCDVPGSYVVTGGGRGIGRAIVRRLLEGGDAVVVLERDPSALAWVDGDPAGGRLVAVAGDAGAEEVTEEAADRAEDLGRLAG